MRAIRCDGGPTVEDDEIARHRRQAEQGDALQMLQRLRLEDLAEAERAAVAIEQRHPGEEGGELRPVEGAHEGGRGEREVAGLRRIGDDVVTTIDVQKSVQTIMKGRQLPPELLGTYIPQIIENMVTERALAFEANRMGVAGIVGDATRVEVLRRAEVERAAHVVDAVPSVVSVPWVPSFP